MMELDEAGKKLSDANAGTIKSAIGLLQRLLRSTGQTPGRMTAQGMRDAAKPGAKPFAKATDDRQPTTDDQTDGDQQAPPFKKKSKKALAKSGQAKPAQEAQRLTEAGVAGMSYAEIGDALQCAIREKVGGYVYLRDIFDGMVVYCAGYGESRLWRCAWSLDDASGVMLSDAEAVVAETIYLPADGSLAACPYCGAEDTGDTGNTSDTDLADLIDLIDPADEAELIDDQVAEADAVLAGDVVALREGAVAKDGAGRIKLIAPGWGSSGYYSEDVLRRDGPKVWPAGTKMYWNHPTVTEESDRPERDLRDLAATLTSDSIWRDDPVDGPGLYADVKIFSDYREAVDELAPYIGTSIRAFGRAEAGEKDGRTGPIITQLTAGQSVDFVTTPGAGGKVLQLFEAARGRGRQVPIISQKESTEVNVKEAEALRAENTRLSESVTDLQSQAAELRRQLLESQAGQQVDQTFDQLDLAKPIRDRLRESLIKNVPVVDGQIDQAAYTATIEAAARAELAYLAAIGAGSGKIADVGNSQPVDQSTIQEAQVQLADALQQIGLTESGAKIAAGGR